MDIPVFHLDRLNNHLLIANICAACHGVHEKVVGPPLTEIATIDAGNAHGIVTWALAPGKKRQDFPQMPSMASLGEAKLESIARYMLEAGAGARK
jgi:cytochrome c